ncbi:hypothetical protein HID58_054120 [Brassica napus]|uniref:MATH domain-containing protein n=1 Tax=Brassica napus TaxID=3708 RepID=A0ABQ8AGQ3_BRANA|nr:hypothetical protein HID58_054120 [Brassica napus]
MRPVPNVVSGSQKLIPTQISSRDSKVSQSSTGRDIWNILNVVYNFFVHTPVCYRLLFGKSFLSIISNILIDAYELINRTLVVYPKGNKNDSGTGYISLYVVIDSSTLTSPRQVVPADLRFYVFNKKEKKYFTIQVTFIYVVWCCHADSDVWQFTINKTMWGFPRVLPLSTFNNLKNGYLYDMDQCEFGVDIIIPPIFEKSELFSVAKSFPNKRFTRFIQGFSTLPSDYLSEEFIIGGISKNLSLYLNLGPQELLKTKPYDKIYARAMLRVPNQGQSNYIVERPLDNWFSPQNIGWGYADFMPLSDLRDSSTGFVRNDMLVVQVEMEAISTTKYFPS